MEHQIDVWAACVDRAVLCSSGSRVSLKAELPQFIMFQLEGWGVMGHHVAPHPAPWKWRSHEHFHPRSQAASILDGLYLPCASSLGSSPSPPPWVGRPSVP